MNQDGPEQTPIPSPADLVLAMTGASGAPYAVRLLQTLCRAGQDDSSDASAPSAIQVLREETGLKLSADRFDAAVFGDLAPGRVVYHHHRRLLGGDRQRVVPDRRHGDHPVQHEHPGRDRSRCDHEPDHPRRRRSPQGTPQADPRPPRDAAEPDPSRKHAPAHPRRRRSFCRPCPAGITAPASSTTWSISSSAGSATSSASPTS